MRYPYFIAALLALAAVLAGCGQKGSLYLRENPPSNVKTPKADQYKPTPYPKGAPADPEPDAESGK
ncbi:MAG: hypothetical protein EXR31_01720 [Betaproteobacteria bacterium]|nr:hypothetical protein [Betaproteobacteria bacterium]